MKQVLAESVTTRLCGKPSVHHASSGVFCIDSLGFPFAEYQNSSDDDDNVSTVVHVKYLPSDFKIVQDIDGRAFSVSEVLRSGVVPQVVNPLSFYRMDSAELSSHVNEVVADLNNRLADSSIVLEPSASSSSSSVESNPNLIND